MKILVVNGPNLNRLGTREPMVYGRQTWADIEAALRDLAGEFGADLECFQSNHEGALIDRLQAASDADGILLNAGGLTHTSVSLRDCVAGLTMPVIEVHLSNIQAREEFRHVSLLTGVCRGMVAGLGPHSYLLGLRYLLEGS